MAASTSFKQQCPSCEAMVPIRDPGLVGKKIDCPKCKYRFVVEAPEDEVDEIEEVKPGKKGAKPDKGATKPAAKGAGPSKKKKDDEDDDDKGGKKKKKGDAAGGPNMVLVGGGLAVVAVGAIVLCVMMWPSGGGSGSSPPAGGPPPGGPPPGGPPPGPGPVAGDMTGGMPTPAPGPMTPGPATPAAGPLQNPTNLLPRDTQLVVSWPIGRTLASSVRMMALESEGGFKPAQFQAKMGFRVDDLVHVLNAHHYKDEWLFTVAQSSKPINQEHLKTSLVLDPPTKVVAKKGAKRVHELFAMKGDFDSLGNLLFKAATPQKDFGVAFVDANTLAFGNLKVLTAFLEDDAKPDPRPENLPSMPESAPMPGVGGPMGGPPPMGGAGPMGGTPPMPMSSAGPTPMPMSSAGPPPMGGPPSGMMGGGPMPGGAIMGEGMGMMGGRPAPAPTPVVSGSYLTLAPGLKSIMDNIEKVEENRETRKRGPNAIIAVASELNALMEASEKQMRKQLGTVPPEFNQGKAQLKMVRSVGAALIAFDQNNANAIVAAEFARPTEAQQIETIGRTFAAPAVKDWIKKTLKLTVTTPEPVMNPTDPMGMGPMGPMGISPPGPGSSAGPRPGSGRGPRPGEGPMPGTSPLPGGGMPGVDGMNPMEEKSDGKLLIERYDRVVVVSLELGLSNEAYGMMTPFVSQAILGAKGVSDMASTRSRVHELAAALMTHVKAKNAFPRGTIDRPQTAEHSFPWRPDQRLSWVVSLLPYLGPEYREWRLDPTMGWNERTNLLFARRLVPQLLANGYQGVGDPMIAYPGAGDLPVGSTNWVGMAGLGLDAAEYDSTNKKRGVFGYDRETKVDEIADGAEQTIALILTPGDLRAPWLAGGGATIRAVDDNDPKPLDAFVCITYPAQPGKKTKFDGQRGTLAIMADGKVRFLPASMPPETFKALCTIDGDDKIEGRIDNVAALIVNPDAERTLSTPAKPVLPVRVPGTPGIPGVPTIGFGKPHVEILMGAGTYRAAAPKLAKGAKVKFKAEIVPLGTSGMTVKLQRGELYTGDQPAVQAVQLMKDFTANKASALEKYRRKEDPELEIIVEGTVMELRPGLLSSSVLLDGQ